MARRHAGRALLAVAAVVCLSVTLHYACPSTGIGEALVNLRHGTVQTNDENAITRHDRLLRDEPMADYQKNYPPELFTFQEKSDGAIVLYAVGMLYMFMALAIVCDECFVPALEVISDRLNLSPDVAGATFMAAGGSAPEFFTNLIGANVVMSDVGIGTIVGSAVFNVLFVIGMCAFASPWPLKLTWYPLARDSLFYTLDLLVLSSFFSDAEIQWYESLVLFILYLTYGCFMKFSEQFEAWIKERLGEDTSTEVEDADGEARWATKREDEQPGDDCRVNPEPPPDVVLESSDSRQCSMNRSNTEPLGNVHGTGSANAENFATIGEAICVNNHLDVHQDASATPGQPSSGSLRHHEVGKKHSTASVGKHGKIGELPVMNQESQRSGSHGTSGHGGENKMFEQRRHIRRSITTPLNSAVFAAESGHGVHSCQASRVALRSVMMHSMLQGGAHGHGHGHNHSHGHKSPSHNHKDEANGGTDSRRVDPCSSQPPSFSKHGVIPAQPGDEDTHTENMGANSNDARHDPGMIPAWTGGTMAPEAPKDDWGGASSVPVKPTMDPPPPDCPCPHTVQACAPNDSCDHREGSKDSNPEDEEDEEEEDSEPLEISFPAKDAGIVAWFQFLSTLPIIFVLVWTVPDVRREGRENLYMLSFGLSIFWIATFTYFMIWFTTCIAYTMGVPVHIMGLTVLAAGTSVPDLLTSVIVAMQGKGDMAVSSSIGSNIFDVTIGLPIPWMLFSAIHGGEPVRVTNKGLGFSIMVLLLMVFCTVMTIKASHWVMSKKLGIVMCCLYVLFMLQSVLVEVYMPNGIQFR
jgi:K+-dependent Na+/Ca+ exchanger-like protein